VPVLIPHANINESSINRRRLQFGISFPPQSLILKAGSLCQDSFLAVPDAWQSDNSGIKPPLPVVDPQKFYRSGESQSLKRNNALMDK
jgi:hypothetical protein